MSLTEAQLSEILTGSLNRAINEIPGADFIDVEMKILFGKPDAILDSLNLVSFVFILEEEVERLTGMTIKITTQDVLNSEAPPFMNLLTLKQFLSKKVTDGQG